MLGSFGLFLIFPTLKPKNVLNMFLKLQNVILYVRWYSLVFWHILTLVFYELCENISKNINQNVSFSQKKFLARKPCEAYYVLPCS